MDRIFIDENEENEKEKEWDEIESKKQEKINLEQIYEEMINIMKKENRKKIIKRQY
jgi:hypothetical protein